MVEIRNQEEDMDYYPIPQRDVGDKALASIATLLKETTQLLPVVRREFRGEGIQQYDDGTYSYVQITKPMFVKMDLRTNKPLRKEIIQKGADGKKYRRKIYIPNDEAIEEVLSLLKFMGLNQITPISNIDENTVLDDLKEFECKLAVLLALKQKSWGIEKEFLPITMTKIKTLVQDARYLCVNGSTIKAIQKTVQRIEQIREGDVSSKKKFNPYH